MTRDRKPSDRRRDAAKLRSTVRWLTEVHQVEQDETAKEHLRASIRELCFAADRLEVES